MPVRRMVVLAAALSVLLGVPAPASAAGDPPLSIDAASALSVMRCPAAFSRPKTPVLLVHGTGLTADESWTHTFAKTLPQEGHDVCTVDLPQRALGDAQIAAEYVVVAIRELASRSGRRIAVLGHSQGGLEPRWALKWFPSTQALVDDYISLSTDHHGSDDATGACAGGRCAPSVWQQRPGSNFLNALNAGDETPGAISYTSIYSLTDEVVPEIRPPATSILAGASSIEVQSLCPGRPVDHFSMLYDAVAHALVDDALDHPGPADPARINRSVCLASIAPGLDASDAAYIQTVALAQSAAATLVTGPMTSAEPPLMPYVLASRSQAAPSPASSSQPSNPPAPAQAPPPRPYGSPSLPATGPRPPMFLPLAALGLGVAARRLRRPMGSTPPRTCSCR